MPDLAEMDRAKEFAQQIQQFTDQNKQFYGVEVQKCDIRGKFGIPRNIAPLVWWVLSGEGYKWTRYTKSMKIPSEPIKIKKPN